MGNTINSFLDNFFSDKANWQGKRDSIIMIPVDNVVKFPLQENDYVAIKKENFKMPQVKPIISIEADKISKLSRIINSILSEILYSADFDNRVKKSFENATFYSFELEGKEGKRVLEITAEE
ncbi:hypothetical protein [Companilactobacillus sp. HBUAS56257]|jgi:hypothetical protein|uniref:hypothetical protein n=1 Tax=Companilactobacillus sp. HBUAS56257 TaxID=3109360 RepID=UPI002FF1F42F